MSKNNFTTIGLTDNVMHIEPHASCKIDDIVAESIKMVAENEYLGVKFKFSGVEMFIDKNSSLEQSQQSYFDGLTKIRKEYEESDAGKEAAKRREEEQKLNQEKAPLLLKEFDTAVKDKSTLIKWIGEFTALDDLTHIEYDRKVLAEKMKENNFNYAFVEDSQFETLDKKTQLEVAIISNAYNTFSKGKKLHPAFATFAQQYEAIEEKEKTNSNIFGLLNKLRPSHKPTLTP